MAAPSQDPAAPVPARRAAVKSPLGRRPPRLPARLLQRWAGRSLRYRLRVLLLVAGLGPTLVLGAVGLRVLLHLSAATAGEGARALEARAQGRLEAKAQQAAAQVGSEFLAVEQQASVLAVQTDYILSNPALFPGDQQGNTPFTRLPGGALINADPTVGVYAPASALADPEFWSQVSLLTHVDPLLRSLAGVACCLPPVIRYWVQTPDGLIRVDPNPDFSAGVRMFPQTALLAYYAAADGSALAAWQRSAWTSPYADPAASRSSDAGDPQIISTVVPVYTDSGAFAGVVGADVSVAALRTAIAAALEPPFTAAVLYRPIAAAGTDAGSGPPRPYPPASSGAPLAAETIAATSAAAPVPSAFGVPSGSAGTQGLGTGVHAAMVAYAPVGVAGWMLAEVAPAAAAEGPAHTDAAALARGAARTETVAAAVLAAATVGLALLLAPLAGRAAATVSEPLRRLAEAVRAMGAEGGAPTADTRPPDADEVGMLTTEFGAQRERLEEATARWRREAEERARAEVGVLREKQRIARDVHDTLAQAFLSIVLLADGGRGRLAQVAEVARQGLRQARRGMAELAPAQAPAAEVPFVQALRREVAEFAATARTPMEAAVEVRDWPELPLPTQVALLGVVRSALGNVREHADARRVAVRLRGADDAAVLEVGDDGRGFDLKAARAGPPDPDRGRGLPGMRARLEEVAGALVVESRPGSGTVVRAIVPVPGALPPGLDPSANGGGALQRAGA